MSLNNVFFIVFLVLSPVFVAAGSSCDAHATCDECIQDSSRCVWCAQENLTTSRCKLKAEAISWCDNGLSIIEPSSYRNSAEESLEFNDTAGNVIQIKPQKMDVYIRVGDSLEFDFSFKSISEYPVDLYFLMDVSQSMKNIKRITARQTKDIYEKMASFTKDVRLGFGSFVDKNAFPYTHYINSTSTYSFKHHLTFTSNHQKFKKYIDDIPLGQNNDDPEGGLDGLAQVIACKNHIGWRKESRKIIIFLTDAVYHAAGDGKWAGIVKPYDGKCYLSENGTYLKELEFDYPSVSIISKMAKQEEIFIIFGVHHQVELAYKALTKAISGSTCITTDSFKRDMAKILQSAYESISQNIRLKKFIPQALRNSLMFEFKPNCDSVNSKPNKDCQVRRGEEMKFRGKLTLLRLPESKLKNMNINISIEGINEKLVLNINVLSECNCKVEYKSLKCFNKGNFKCGICECNSDRFGKNCECENDSVVRGDNSNCFHPDTGAMCSGQGTCTCGLCQCNDGYAGAHCECDNESCHREAGGALCGGHGTCDCGVCKCDPPWAGEFCDCSTSQDKCYTSDTIICSNAGKCECNFCKCNGVAEWDARVRQNELCQMLPCNQCHVPQCQKLLPCTKCHYQEQLSEKRFIRCHDVCYGFTNIGIEFSNNSGQLWNESRTWNLCKDVRSSTGCYMNFGYQYDNNLYSINLLIIDENCAESYYRMGGFCLGTIIAVGILTLLCWKFFCDYQDRKEYRSFIKNLESNTREFINPLHVDPVTRYNNPMCENK